MLEMLSARDVVSTSVLACVEGVYVPLPPALLSLPLLSLPSSLLLLLNAMRGGLPCIDEGEEEEELTAAAATAALCRGGGGGNEQSTSSVTERLR